TISLTKLGHLCQVCAGIYGSSFLVALGGMLGLLTLGPSGERKALSSVFALAWLVALALVSLIPAVVYAAGVPDERPYLSQCGELKQPKMKGSDPLKLRGQQAVRPALFFEDPMCPTCKAFHERLITENVIEKLDIALVLFPLDSECNWMLDRPLHPGACIVSKAVLCGEGNARQVLEWAYAEQEYLTRAGKA